MENAPKPKPKWYQRKWVWVVGGLLVLMVISTSGNKSNTPSQPAKPDKSTQTSGTNTETKANTQTANPPAPAPKTPQVLIDLPGSGSKQTQKFTAAGDWDLEWSYDCSSFGQQGNFIVTVYNNDGSMSLENSAVSQLGKNSTDVQHYHKGGIFYLDISSECSWHVTAKG